MSYRPYEAIINQTLSQTSKVFSDMQNDSGSTISALQPVCSDSSGKIKAIDVTVDSDALKVIGLAIDAIPNGSSGSVIHGGRILNVSTSFAQGDYLYVAKDGTLTNSLPSDGVAGFGFGDFVIRVGIVVRNNTTPSNKDIIVNLQIVGRL
jgi:hypothetical protein